MLSKKKCAAFAAILLAASSVFCACTQTKQDTATISNNETAAEKPEESVDEADAEKPEESADESDTAEYAEKVSFNTDVKDATKITAEANNAIYELLDFSDEQEREFAEKGFLSAPDSLVLKREDGTVVWSQDAYSFARDNDAPGSANPSLWRNTQLNALYGLFEVTDGIYQVRGYDVANLTFVRGEKGWIVFDCTTSIETAEAGLALFREKFSDAKISAVVISHAHIDHYGGIGGLVTQEELADSSLSLEEQADSGKTLLIVPEGFEKAVMEENVFAGNAMKRRSNYQYGSLLERGERGSLSVGIGLTTSGGTTSYLSPTYEVTDDIFEATVDGVDMVFQLTPGTESPAEMNTYLPGYKALWMAENCTGTMHNLYTLRGAEVRDANAWAQYIMEAKAQFGEEAEVVFQSHNWPHWGNDVINEYLLNTASVYKYIYSQTLQYLNEGYTSTEIANMISLPADLEKIWYTRQYYGTLEHNVKAVYQKYMGWYDANPIHLDELEPSEYAKKMVEYLGDTDDVLAKAKEDFDKGEYQWVAQITNTIVYAEPDNENARCLCADALEQLGYQAESGAWRNAYLTAAYELRHGTDDYPQTIAGGTGATAFGMSTETMLDYLGICLDAKKIEDQNLTLLLQITDEDSQYLVQINHGVLLYSKNTQNAEADVTIKTKRVGILGIARGSSELLDANFESVEGDKDVIETLTGNLAEFPPYFNIIEP